MLAAQKGIDVICQKPMAPSLEISERMVRTCKEKNVQFLSMKTFDGRHPIRALKKAMDEGVIGRPFKARLAFCSAFSRF